MTGDLHVTLEDICTLPTGCGCHGRKDQGPLIEREGPANAAPRPRPERKS